MIHWGIQDHEWARKTWDFKSSAPRVDLVPVKERFVHIYLPWRRTIYCINSDAPVKSWLRLGLWWHKHPNAAHWFIRAAYF